MSRQADSLQDHFLIAMPQMLDPNFGGTLTYLCEHSEQGAMGIVINKPSGLHLSEVLEQLEMPSPDDDKTVYAGGPVQIDRGFILHNSERDFESSMKVSDSLTLTTSKDILEAIGQGNAPKKYLVALGYAGWGAGQLEKELSENTWLICRANYNVLFETPDQDKLKSAIAILGIDPDQLNGQVGHA